MFFFDIELKIKILLIYKYSNKRKLIMSVFRCLKTVLFATFLTVFLSACTKKDDSNNLNSPPVACTSAPIPSVLPRIPVALMA